MKLSELKKALTSASDGANLNPYDLEQTLHEELLSLQPLAQLLDIKPAEGKTHEYSVRTSHPMAWFEGESTTANDQTGGYTRKSVQLKIQRIWGSVTGFAQKVDERFIDALATEISNSVLGMADLMEYGAMYGTANDIGFTGDAYQYSGMLPRVYAYAPTNVIDAAGAKVTLDMLDQALAKVTRYRNTRNDPGLWMMGIRMKQVVDGLQSKVQLPLTSAELADGKLVMAAYGKFPIYETDYVVPADTSTSPACTGALHNAAGSIPAGIYTYAISSVTAYGEQVVGTASGNVTTADTNLAADLTWTHDDNAKLYMIWRKKSTESVYSLIDIIPALTYDSAGKVNGVKESYTDDGTKAKIAIEPLASGEQMIVFTNTNPTRGSSFIGMVDDMGRPVENIASYVELARTKDSYDYLLKSYMAYKLVHPNLVSCIRHVKLA